MRDGRHRARGAGTARSCRRRRRRARGAAAPCCHTTIEPQSWPTNDGLVLADVVEQAEEVVGEVDDVVVVDRLGPARPAVAALVGRDRVVAGVGERPGAGGATSTPARGSRGRARRREPSPASTTCSSTPLVAIVRSGRWCVGMRLLCRWRARSSSSSRGRALASAGSGTSSGSAITSAMRASSSASAISSAGVASRFQKRAMPRPMIGSVAAATNSAAIARARGRSPPADEAGRVGARPCPSAPTTSNHGSTSRSHAAS